VISITHIRNMPEADRRTFYKEWHSSMVYLSRTVGAFKFLSEGYRPPEPKAKKGKKGGPPMPMLIGGGVGALVVVIGLLWFLGVIG
jgi:hypothetical protein